MDSSSGGAAGRKLLQSTRRCSPHPNDASAEMSAQAVLALIDAFCGTPQSKILGSILDQPSRSPLWLEIYGIVFPALSSSAYALAQTAHTCDCDDTFLRDSS